MGDTIIELSNEAGAKCRPVSRSCTRLALGTFTLSSTKRPQQCRIALRTRSGRCRSHRRECGY